MVSSVRRWEWTQDSSWFRRATPVRPLHNFSPISTSEGSDAPLYPIRPISMRQIAELLTEHSGRSFGVEQISAEADVEDLMASGTGRSFATLLNETWAMATAKGEERDPAPYPATTARYRIEDFIRAELVPAIRSSRPTSDCSTATRPRDAA